MIYHGGQSNIATLNLGDGEYLTQAAIGQGTRNGDKRILYVDLSTNLGNKIEGGQKTSDEIKLEAPAGWYIAGFYGRTGQELDQLSVVYRPLN